VGTLPESGVCIKRIRAPGRRVVTAAWRASLLKEPFSGIARSWATMDQTAPQDPTTSPIDAGLRAVCGIAAYYRIGADPTQLARELALNGRPADDIDIVRSAQMIGLKARIVNGVGAARLARLPIPAIVRARNGAVLVVGRGSEGQFVLIDPISHAAQALSVEEIAAEISGRAVLIARRVGGSGIDPHSFSIRWFLPTIWRYRKPIGHALAASLFVQIFALTTPLIFQVVVDKVLTHRSYETLYVLIGALVVIGMFDVALQYLRMYALSHTTNRMDVELGQRLFAHLLHLPMSYFETRAAGQTVARVRELETIRSFLTGQGLFSAIDLLFAFVFVAVMFAYSWRLTLIVLCTVPVYILIGFTVRPLLRDLIKEKFNRGAATQQFLVETIVGAGTIKSAAVEPLMRAQWEEKLAAYVKTSFAATMLGTKGQLSIQYVSKLTTAAILLFGAKAVIDGELTVGALIAFNMIAAQAVQPILRLSQLWQDFQQVQISIDRLGDILNAPTEPAPLLRLAPPTPRGAIELRRVTFHYGPGGPDVLKNVSLAIRPGETIGIVGPSGSGKSTLTKLVQRLYLPNEGQVFLDGADLSQVDPAWLRSHIGVVLQENLLFNRTIHENIAFANPAMPRARVIQIARLAGADEFIDKLPAGYDTMIEERGANLSGGQRQRIAIARALATNPRILILDEATSALDYESERIIQLNMRSIVKDRTVIIIAHRLAAVRGCNRIVGIADGRIVEIGTHDELLRRQGGLYAYLWSLQSSPPTETFAEVAQ
jgi:ATP-binding cassette, subfamily B, bacterial HlyB/CyaB